jgi:hypothetical protein
MTDFCKSKTNQRFKTDTPNVGCGSCVFSGHESKIVINLYKLNNYPKVESYHGPQSALLSQIIVLADQVGC